MRYLGANCIIPVSGVPCYDSVLAFTDEGMVEGIYLNSELNDPGIEIHQFKGILCPGFINTHCHLELSYAQGLISEGKGLDTFVRQLEILKEVTEGSFIQQAMEKAATDMHKSGIVATADIANGDTTESLKRDSKLYFHTFIEVFGSNPANADGIFNKATILKEKFERNSLPGGVSIVPHATYSLSEELFRLVASSSRENLISIHHQENQDENLLFKDGRGPIAARRNAFNPGLPEFKGTGKRPLESIAGFFGREQKILFVHNTVTEKQDIDFVENYFSNACWCFCPNANLYIEKKLPDIRLFLANGCKITLGTDSLASNHQLSILEEMKTISQYFPEIPLPELLRWATKNGAEFLGLDSMLGSFEKGKKPGVVLIENTDIQSLKLNKNSTSRLIIPAGL